MSRRATLFASTLCTALVAIALRPLPAQAGQTLPASLRAVDRGASDPAQTITLTVHLKMSDRAGFEKTLAALYDRASPSFHKWLSDADLRKFAPSQAHRDAVRQALEAHGLTVLGTDKNGFSLRARGKLGDVARAFNTELHDFVRNGETFRRNITPAQLDGEAAAYVDTVAGLESHRVHPMLTRAKNLVTGKSPANIPLTKANAGVLGKYISDVGLTASQSFTYTTSGGLPSATYTGIVYNENPNLTIDFSPKALVQAYGLGPVYAAGLTGAGQTIVLLEGYGYPTIQSDANAFAKLTGLPQLTASNFNIVYPEGAPLDPNAGILTGWNTEIALDMDSSHAIAPGANIVVVATTGQDSEDFQYSMQYIVDNGIGTTVSDSWEEDQDLLSGPAEQQSFETVLELAAAKGVSFQFSTGDSGDGGLGTPLGAPGVPSVAPHATAVGGTAILNNPGGKGFTHVGWGDTISYVNEFGPLVPPEASFYAGGGGGESVYWPKPAWQSALPGLGRQTPDVSALADPFTGVPIVLTNGSQQEIEVGWGGTSLASPIFTAFWAIAQQAAGGPLGQASPTIAALKTGLIDVVASSNPNNITGSVTTSSGTTNYTTADIFAGALEQNTPFIGAIWNVDDGNVTYGFAFGADSSLSAGKGWDNATGYGTPHGLKFIQAVAAYTAP